MQVPGRMNSGGNSERSRFTDRFNGGDSDDDEDDDDDYTGDDDESGDDDDDGDEDVPMNKSRGGSRRRDDDVTIVEQDQLSNIIKGAVSSQFGNTRSTRILAKAIAAAIAPIIGTAVDAAVKPLKKSLSELYQFNSAFADHADDHFAALHNTNTELAKAYEGLPATIAMVKSIADSNKSGATAPAGGPSPAPNGSAPTPEQIAAAGEALLQKSFTGGMNDAVPYTPASPVEVNKAIEKAEKLQEQVRRPCEGLSEVMISKANGMVSSTQIAALNEGIVQLEKVAARM